MRWRYPAKRSGRLLAPNANGLSLEGVPGASYGATARGQARVVAFYFAAALYLANAAS